MHSYLYMYVVYVWVCVCTCYNACTCACMHCSCMPVCIPHTYCTSSIDMYTPHCAVVQGNCVRLGVICSKSQHTEFMRLHDWDDIMTLHDGRTSSGWQAGLPKYPHRIPADESRKRFALRNCSHEKRVYPSIGCFLWNFDNEILIFILRPFHILNTTFWDL